MSQHAMLSPSGAHRWMTCPGSVAMEASEPESSSEYADEGTAAHALAALCLRDGTHPVAYAGRVLEVVNGVCSTGHTGDWPPPKLRGHRDNIARQFKADAEFVAGVNAYVQKIREYAAGHTFYVEERVPTEHFTGEEGGAGTADVVVITTDRELQAHDLKFGRGVKVFAKSNPQCLSYLSGVRKKFPGDYERFRIVIHQPRLNHLDEWACTAAELDAFEQEAHVKAGLAMNALATQQDWMPLGADTLALVVSDKGCEFCNAAAKCPKLARHVQDTVGAEFPVLAQGALTGEPLDALIPTDLAALGLKQRAVDLIEDWCKAVRAKIESALFEFNNSAEAQATLGHKLVQGRKGNRHWKNEQEAEERMKKMRLKQEQMYDFSLITPTAAETLLKEQPKRWAALQELIGQNDGRPSVAPLDDKRAALELKPVAADEFAVAVADGSDLV